MSCEEQSTYRKALKVTALRDSELCRVSLFKEIANLICFKREYISLGILVQTRVIDRGSEAKVWSHTDFNKRIIRVVPEETVGTEGDDGIDQWHIQNPYTRHTGSDDSEACTRESTHLPLFLWVRVVPCLESTF